MAATLAAAAATLPPSASSFDTAASPPLVLAGLMDLMRLGQTRAGNCALFVQPDNLTAVYFAPGYLVSQSKHIHLTTSSDGGLTFSTPVAQLATSSENGTADYELPQVLPSSDGSWANLMFEFYPLGLKSGRALWNTSTSRYDWPLEWQSLANVDVVQDGGINRPAIALTLNSAGVRRLFHIGAVGNNAVLQWAQQGPSGGGVVVSPPKPAPRSRTAWVEEHAAALSVSIVGLSSLDLLSYYDYYL